MLTRPEQHGSNNGVVVCIIPVCSVRSNDYCHEPQSYTTFINRPKTSSCLVIASVTKQLKVSYQLSPFPMNPSARHLTRLEMEMGCLRFRYMAGLLGWGCGTAGRLRHRHTGDFKVPVQ